MTLHPRLRRLVRHEANLCVTHRPLRPDATQVRCYGGRDDAGRGRPSPKDSLAQRDFFFDVLNVNATRRDAKQYLAQFNEDSRRKEVQSKTRQKLNDDPKSPAYARGINLGSLYKPPAATVEAPTFKQYDDEDATTVQDQKPILHTALVSIRELETINDRDLDGVALTLSQLVRLGMRITLTFDCNVEASDVKSQRLNSEKQAERLARVLRKHNPAGARYIESCLQVDQDSARVQVALPKLILEPLKQACIPIIPCLAYTESCQKVAVNKAGVMNALTRCLSGTDSTSTLYQTSEPLSLDRIIMIDHLGGIPSTDREGGSHVFVNMEQEYDYIADELSSGDFPESQAQHLSTLTTLKECLAILPPTSSAVIISPWEAAISSRPSDTDSDPATIRTRRQKNPLIHNLLTNRPVISSSLPTARMTSAPSTAFSRSTLLKRGMPVALVPDPRKEPWVPPSTGVSDVLLDNHKQIHFPRLLALVEDSFRRKLDVPGYLDRVRGHVAGVIVAGEYEGGAILTWEAPPGSDNDPKRLVPYLDKFAVLQKAQGNAGVADIVFQAMVRTGFPNGVCWRSRSENPVNKWYFERSIGTWKLPGGYWTMFWTTPSDELIMDKQKWHDYVAVCQGIMPTWSDSKKAE